MTNKGIRSQTSQSKSQISKAPTSFSSQVRENQTSQGKGHHPQGVSSNWVT